MIYICVLYFCQFIKISVFGSLLTHLRFEENSELGCGATLIFFGSNGSSFRIFINQFVFSTKTYNTRKSGETSFWMFSDAPQLVRPCGGGHTFVMLPEDIYLSTMSEIKCIPLHLLCEIYFCFAFFCNLSKFRLSAQFRFNFFDSLPV